MIFSAGFCEPHSALCYTNRLIEKHFRARDFDVDAHYMITQHPPQPTDAFMPFGHWRVAQAVARKPPADVAVYDDLGLYAHLPTERVAKRVMAFFHGLAGGRAVWTGSLCTRIAAYCANSPYVARVLQSALAAPLPGGSGCLHPDPFGVVHTVRLPVADGAAFREAPERAELPQDLAKAFDERDVLGHAIQPGKLDFVAASTILVQLNLLAKELGRPGRYRLCIFEDDLTALGRLFRSSSLDNRARHARDMLQRQLEAARLSVDDLFVGVPWLSQSALFALMKRCRFGLAYNTVPEALGFYVIESVLNGCPIYTNGAGNYRFLLPPGMGVRVLETTDMHFGDLASYREVARHIVDDLESGRGHEECARGAARLRLEYSSASFAADLDECIRHLDDPPAVPIDADRLIVALSPVVRAWDGARRVVSDYVSTELPEEQADLLGRAIGRPWAEVRKLAGARQDDIESLFSHGLVALTAPEPSSAH
jgi:hypothetical protein